MLAAKYKISSSEFKSHFNKGLKKSSKYFRISFSFAEKEQNTKYAVVISKKVLRTAVSRHQNKRKIYKIIRQLYPQFSKLQYVFICIQQDVRGVDDDVLLSDISQLLSKK